MLSLHLIRPWFLLGFIALGYLAWRLHKYCPLSAQTGLLSWCDQPLLAALMKQRPRASFAYHPLWIILMSLAWMLIAASGPAWKKLPIPLFSAQNTPKVVLFDLSQNMLAADVSPNRLQRALFVAHDLLSEPDATPIGLIAYTQEPFTVSPLTDDSHTITALLPSLNTSIAPIGGQDLRVALQAARALLTQAHFQTGAILVLTGSPPNEQAIDEASALADSGISVSILPIAQYPIASPLFQSFADSGAGKLLSLQQSQASLKQWLQFTKHRQQDLKSKKNHIARWEDEGRWFLIPALLCLLPVFRRGWLRG
ncbi:MAG: VWA domain-containing protein [Gammaproteobacteria bacterium]|nr:VWA domain-containing protein [Gammaproteobacteria bacterium]